MANNPFDPPIVQVKKTLNRGGLGTVNRGYGSMKFGALKTREAPPSDQPEWWPENLSELGDVDVDEVEDGQVLVWNEAEAKWLPEDQSGGGGGWPENLSELGDVDVDGLEDGQVLVWDETESKWLPGNQPGGWPENLSELGDVDVDGLEDGQVLVWDETESKWLPGPGVLSGQWIVRAEGGIIDPTTGGIDQVVYHADMPAVVFKAPPSGRVVVVVSAYIRSAAVNRGILVGATVWTGDVIGSGSIFKAGSLYDGIANYNDQTIRGQGLYFVEGLTPGAMYNARSWYYQDAGTGHRVNRPVIQVIPL